MISNSANKMLRLEQFDTVLYNANLNPMGVPESAKKAILENAERVCCYPGDYMTELNRTVAMYTGCRSTQLFYGNGTSDVIRRVIAAINPGHAVLLTPSNTEYETLLSARGCEITFYDLKEENDFAFDLADFVGTLDSSCDMIIIGNPNSPTSQLISRETLDTLAEVCKELDIFLVVDELYMEFAENYRDYTMVPNISEYDNLVVIRGTSKFFAVPGMRLSCGITNSSFLLDKIANLFDDNTIATLTAIATIAMLNDTKYVEESRSQIYTERNLIVSAMGTNKNIKLYKPAANFMLARILKEGVNAVDITDHCNAKGIVIRNCANIRGLSEKYIRFCFMKPSQNDLLVNTILEML
jgi:threonine-phosphate decarboxylase